MSLIDTKYPLQTKDGDPVELVTVKSRNENYPIMGYVGVEKRLSNWSADGVPEFGGFDSYNSLRNAPFTGHVFVAIYDDGRVEHFYHESEVAESVDGSKLIGVAKTPYSILPGQRDDVPEPTPVLDQIVKEFSDVS